MMEDLCDRTIQLLDRQISDPAFERFCLELGEAAQFEDVGESFISKSFEQGITLHFVRSGRCSQIVFHLATASTQSGAVRPYFGRLPYGVVHTDSRTEVAQKLGAASVESRLLRDSGDQIDRYSLPQMRLSF